MCVRPRFDELLACITVDARPPGATVGGGYALAED